MDKLLVADQSALCYDQHGAVGHTSSAEPGEDHTSLGIPADMVDC